MASIIDVVEENDTGVFKVTTLNNKYNVFLNRGMVTVERPGLKPVWGTLNGPIRCGETLRVYEGEIPLLLSSPVTKIEKIAD